MSLSVRGELPDVQIAIQIFTLSERLRITTLAHHSSVDVENDHQVWLSKRPHGNFAFGERGNRNRILHGNRTKQCAVGGENLDEVRATVRYINLPVGSAVAVFPEHNCRTSLAGIARRYASFVDRQNLLVPRIEHQQAR